LTSPRRPRLSTSLHHLLLRLEPSRRRLVPMVGRLQAGFVGSCLRRAHEVEATARAAQLASLSFTSGIPLLIVLSALAPRGRDVAERVIHRFHLSGATAEQVRSLFVSPTDEGTVTVIGLVLLFGSMVGMASSLQIIYERCFFFPHVGIRARWRSATWIFGTAVYVGYFIQLRPNVYSGGTNIARALLSLAGSFVYLLWTPRIMLGPRITVRRLVPYAALTTVAVTILVLVSPLYMPKMIHDDAARFGMIGVAFALLSWLVVLAFLLVGAAVIASEIDRRRGPTRAIVAAGDGD
jgi:membrane protein